MSINWPIVVEAIAGSKDELLKHGNCSVESYYVLKRKANSKALLPSSLKSNILKGFVKDYVFKGLTETHISYFERSQKLSLLKAKAAGSNLIDREQYVLKLHTELIDLLDNAVSETAPAVTYFLWLSLVTKIYFALAFEMEWHKCTQQLEDRLDALLARAHYTPIRTGHMNLDPITQFKAYAEKLTILNESLPRDLIERNRFVFAYLGHNAASAYFMWAVKYKEGIGGFDINRLLENALFEAESLFRFSPDNALLAWNCLAWSSYLENAALCEIWASRLIAIDPKVSNFSGGRTKPGKSMTEFAWFDYFVNQVAPKIYGQPYTKKGGLSCAA